MHTITDTHFLSYLSASVAQVDQLPAKDLSKVDSQSVPSAASVKQDVLPPPVGDVVTEEGEAETSKLLTDNLTEDKNVGLMDAQTEGKEKQKNNLLYFRESNTLNTRARVFRPVFLPYPSQGVRGVLKKVVIK